MNTIQSTVSLPPKFALSNSRRISVAVVVALTLVFLRANATAQDVDLGTANNFTVLAGSAITSTGPSVINAGDVGLTPGSSITGFPPGTITPPFTMHVDDAVALQAQNDLTTAYKAAAGLARTATLTGLDLGGMTLTPGIYFFASSAQLTGTLTLNNEGNPDAVFVFQIGSTLTTASGSKIVTINDGPIPDLTPGISVFWQIGSSATLGTGTDFEGNILAKTSITADTGAIIDGRLLAENGAVTLNDNLVTAPPAEVIAGEATVRDGGNALLLLGFGLWTLFAIKGCLALPVVGARQNLSLT
jgi:hypothetical protein